MSRIRSIKPELGHHDKLSIESAEVHLFAALLPCFADDDGYFNANPKLVHAGVCPLRELILSIPEILGRLVHTGYLELVDGSDGRHYARITNFHVHQRVAHPTPGKIKLLMSIPEIFGTPPESGRPDLGSGTRNVELGNGTGNMEEVSDIESQIREIAKFHPKIGDPSRLSHEYATVIGEAIVRHGDRVLVGVKRLHEICQRDPDAKKFAANPSKYFRNSDYMLELPSRQAPPGYESQSAILRRDFKERAAKG